MVLTAQRQNSVKEMACREAQLAFEQTRAYRELLGAAHTDPSTICDEGSFHSLPLTDREYYRSNYPDGVITEGTVLSQEPHVLKTRSSGSAGNRLTTVVHTYDLARRMSDTTSVHPRLKRQLMAVGSNRIARYAAPNCSDVECAAPNSTMESRILSDGSLVLPVAHDLMATRASLVDQAIDEIETYRPNWFYVDATHFAFLLRQYRVRQLAPPKPTAVILTYTLPTMVARRQIEAVFGHEMPIVEVVSMSELGWLAMECEFANLHLNTAAFYTELLDSKTWSPVTESRDRRTRHYVPRRPSSSARSLSDR